MSASKTIRVDALERLFHEPNRLAIIATLVGANSGLTFGELKKACRLTDGNLSRHLQTLEAADVVTITKDFVGKRPRTTVALSDDGKERFLEYITALEVVLQEAATRLKRDRTSESDVAVPRSTQPARS